MPSLSVVADNNDNFLDLTAFLGFDITVEALDGDDVIWTADGDDVVFGGLGNDEIRVGDGDDEVYAGNGDDFVAGGNGNDVIQGAGGNDYLHAGKGNDIVYGGSGDDTILGIKGNNQLFGQAGNDYISTGDNTSTADGGTGNDTINVRMKKGGDHVLTGGEGADLFEFMYAFDDGKDSNCVITDYELGVDSLVLTASDGFLGTGPELALNAIGNTLLGLPGHTYSVVDGDIQLNLSSGDSILFEGISEADYISYFLGL